MRYEQLNFEITFVASTSGVRKHMVSAENKEAAIARIHRAYPGQEINITGVRQNSWIIDTKSKTKHPLRGFPRR